MTSLTLFRYSPLIVTTSPERAVAGAKELKTIGSVYSRSNLVEAVRPSEPTTVTGPTWASIGTVRRISLRLPEATVWMLDTEAPPAKRTSETLSRLAPMIRSSAPRITGLGATAASASFPAYWSVSSSSFWQAVRPVMTMRRVAKNEYLNIFFMFCSSYRLFVRDSPDVVDLDDRGTRGLFSLDTTIGDEHPQAGETVSGKLG